MGTATAAATAAVVAVAGKHVTAWACLWYPVCANKRCRDVVRGVAFQESGEDESVADLGCAHAFATSGWADLGTEPTCVTANCSFPRRIDLLLANPALQRIASAASCSWGLSRPLSAG